MTKKIVDHLYQNAQLTIWSNANDYEAEGASSGYKFIIPGKKDNCLLMIRWGGVTDYLTDMLLSVTSEGVILDQMPVAVWCSAPKFLPVMQFKVTADAKVIVYRLIPTSEKSVPLLGFKSFIANRVDKTYFVDEEGKFQLIDTKKYRAETYTLEQLTDKSYNIWDGNEIQIMQ